MAMSVQLPAALLPIQLSATALGKAAVDATGGWIPATYVGHLDGILAPCIALPHPRPNCCRQSVSLSVTLPLG